MIEIIIGTIGLLMLMGSMRKDYGTDNPVIDTTSDYVGWIMPDINYTSYNTKNIELNDVYKKHGEQKGVDWKLLKAIAIVESGENAMADNPNDPSYGLMQLLYRIDDKGNVNQLNVLNWPPENINKLYEVDYNVHIGSQIIAWNISEFGLKKGIACYNNWSARNFPDEGPFPNQNYVDKVLKEYNNL